MKAARFAGIAVGLFLSAPVPGLAQVGTLAHDGPATPEQISMYLPVTGSVSANLATVRYRPTSGSTWTTAHPLHRIRPSFSADPVSDAFAGVITGLTPGIDYTVEITIPGGTPIVRTMTATTRALPGPAGSANKTISAGATSAQIQSMLDGLNPGDVLQFTNGVYVVNNLSINRSGTDSQPIYIRGASRAGVILKDGSGRVIYMQNASNVVLEDLTIEGSLVDSGTNASSEGIRFFDGFVQRKVTLRRLIVRGVDMGVVSDGHMEQLLVYDCTFTGNNVWTQPFLESNLSWNDDGTRVPGFGNAVFNNTMAGFGDTFAVDSGTQSAAVHFYRNDVRFTCDDAFEGDYGFRNLTFYDNRVHNSMTLTSFDPISGGPAFVFRNFAINTGRSPYKFNNTNTGHFIYNNTVVRTNGYGSGEGWGWNQSDNGPQRAWGYCNNLLIYRGSGNLMAMEASGMNPIDFTNNAWYPDRSVWWSSSGGSYSSVAAARAGLPATTPVFGTSTQRHGSDVISDSDPFITDVVLGSTYLTQITTFYSPFVANGTAPRSAGRAIPGITDGFSGTAPDIGAMITGIPAPAWGDRTGAGPLDTLAPAPPANLTAQ